MNTTLCYIRNENNEYLLLHRNKKENDLNEGKWIGVGGKFADGETAEECVCREVFEETGRRGYVSVFGNGVYGRGKNRL